MSKANPKTVRVLVESAVALTAEEIAALQTNLGLAKDAVIENKVDKDLLGGLRVHVADQVLDLTLKNRVQIIKDKLAAYED